MAGRGAKRVRDPFVPTFVSVEAKTNYEKIRSAELIVEHEFDPNTLQDMSELRFICEKRLWKIFLETGEKANKALVAEVYANLFGKEDWINEGWVEIRGRRVDINSILINAFYECDNCEYDEYSAFRDAGRLDDVLKVTCKPGAVWNYGRRDKVRPISVDKKHLTSYAFAWLKVVNTRFIPTTHDTQVTLDRLVLIYSILKGHTIDVGKVILGSIIKCAKETKPKTLTFPSLLTYLCHKAGLEDGPRDDLVEPYVSKLRKFGVSIAEHDRSGASSSMPIENAIRGGPSVNDIGGPFVNDIAGLAASMERLHQGNQQVLNELREMRMDQTSFRNEVRARIDFQDEMIRSLAKQGGYQIPDTPNWSRFYGTGGSGSS